MHFEVAAASQELGVGLNQILDRHVRDRQVVQIKVGKTTAIMQRASAGIVASGSATLEAAYFRLPFVLIYKVAWPTYLVARLVVNVKYLGMPNVLAEREIVPEFIQHQANPEAIAKAVWQLIVNESAREQMISDFDAVVGKLGKSDAGEKAAGAIIAEIGNNVGMKHP
jgi:lipid-A-disaccharide synthase